MMIGGYITIAGSQGGFDFSAGGRQAHVASLRLAVISGWPETVRFRRDDGIDGIQYQDRAWQPATLMRGESIIKHSSTVL